MGTDSIDAPRQLRLVIEADDFDEAVRFSRDVLGMPEQPAFAIEGDDRVSILHAGIAPPVQTPFRTVDARVQGPAGWQVTFFQELETLDERRARPGFLTDDERP